MGSSLSQTSRNLSKDNSNCNVNNSNNKENRTSKPRFASPENRVLPIVTNGPQRLRSTDNGNILQSGGTISGRKNVQANDSDNYSEFTRFLQKKSHTYQSSPQNVSFQTLFGHRKSHSDPDIVRKMMEENETEEDDDGKFETGSNTNQRSIIALSPSKAKIKSRKKKKAPEPPQSNTLPRTLNGRNSSKYETQEISKFNSTYESTEAPRRPLPPIPLEEMPPPPPPPPPDYNRTMNNREILKSPGKNFQKNRRIVDKWKFCKPNFEYFVERRQRSKSLDRTDDIRLRDKELNPDTERFDRNYSLRNLSHREDNVSPQEEDVNLNSKNSALHDAIIDAAKKRAERIARNRNLSFRSSMNQPYEVEIDDTGETVKNSVDSSLNEKSRYRNGNAQSHINGYRSTQNNKDQDISIKDNEQVCSNRNLEQHINRLKSPFENEIVELSTRTQQNLQKCFIEQRISRSSENLDGFAKGQKYFHERNRHNHNIHHVKDQYSYKQCYYSNHSLVNPNSNSDSSFKAQGNPCANRDSCYQNSRDPSTIMQYDTKNKRSFEYNGDVLGSESSENLRPYSAEKIGGHQQYTNTNSVDVTKLSNGSHYRPESDNPTSDSGNNVSRSFSRVSAIRKRSQDNKRKSSPDYRSKPFENFPDKSHDNKKLLDLGILPPVPNEKQTKRSSKPHETIIPFLSNCTVSSSSISEEEMEIHLLLRPTLPRRPVDIPRFSPTDVWKSINLDFFKSHQQRSDVSSENGEDIMEEKIHRINRPVAPRRLIHDRSGDSGISPDAGSPMFSNENLDCPIIINSALCSPNEISNEDVNNTWIPQHDLDDSDCGSNTSKENKFNTSNEMVQPKLAMPNFMFPSRSLPRSDSKNEIQDKDIADKEKTRSRDKRKKSARNSEAQHFNSLRNLKRALGIKPKVLSVDVNGLDSNWSLSRSLPNFENVNNLDDAKIESKVPDVTVLDHIRRSNSESRMMQQENNKNCSMHYSQYKNSEWRKSFPGQSSEGHVMYLPQYCSTTMPCQTNSRNINLFYVEEAQTANDMEHTDRNLDCESTDKKPKNKKKFSYQSTIRQLEKKKLEEQLAKEIQEKEKKRETEIEWMNIVEDEFRKQRIREKSDVKQKLRIFNLEANKDAKFSSCSDSQIRGSNSEIDTEKENSKGFEEDIKCSSAVSYNNMDKAYIQENAQNVCNDDNSRNTHIFNTSDPIQRSNEIFDQRTDNYPQEVDSSHQYTHVQTNFYQETSAINKTVQQSNYQRHEEQMKVIKGNSHNTDVSKHTTKTVFAKNMIHNEPNGREVSINENFSSEKDLNGDNNKNGTYAVEYNRIVDSSSYFGQNNLQRQNNIKENNRPLEKFQTNNHDKVSNYVNNISPMNSYSLNDKLRDTCHQGFVRAKEIGRFEKTETTYGDRLHQNYIPSFEDSDERKNSVKDNDGSYSTQQPTGMKKWLRRQNREHQCHENIPRPEPEGGRSSSDDCKQVDGKRDIVNGRSQPIGANFPSHIKCSHGRSFHCGICNEYETQTTTAYSKHGVENNVSSVSTSAGRSGKGRDDRFEVHPKTQISKMNGSIENHSDVPEFVRDSMEEYELHTRLCRTNSGRTFESHSYYALERRRDDSIDYESVRKPNISKEHQRNFFSSANFEKELKENIKKKSRDAEKRSRKYQSSDFDSDESGSDGKEVRYQRYNARNLKKRSVADHREPSFSRNHPHRNGARLKAQTNGQFVNGRTPSASKNNHPHAVQQNQTKSVRKWQMKILP